MFDKSIDEIKKEFKVDISNGLEEKDIEERIKIYGKNKFDEKKQKGILKLFLEQFKDYLIIILIIAALVSIILGEFLDGLVIIFIIILNSCLGVYQENKANNAFAALKKMSQPNIKVLRDKKIYKINTESIVPGDIIILETGDKIPADIRLIESYNLKTNEASLTGEFDLVKKDANIILDKKVILADRINCVYAGTIVAAGRGRGIAFNTGMKTEIGKIAGELNNTPEQTTPLQKKLNHFGKILSLICLFVCVLIFILGLLHGDNLLEIFMTAVSLAVAAIPEGLTVVVTVILALGMQNMIKSNVIIKRLSAVETLGSVTVICSDKTGTLTQNKMTVVKIFIDNKIFDLDKKIKSKVNKLFEIAVLCNDAENKNVGDPTESCLVEAAEKFDINKKELDKKYIRKDEIAFDSERKLMSTVNLYENNKLVLNTKGAPDEILKRAEFIFVDNKIRKISDEDKNKIIETNNLFASKSYRILGFAFKNLDNIKKFNENNLVFVGLVGMIDPPREEAKKAIEACKNAGIKVKMITGDHKKTAIAIAKDLKIISQDNQAIDGAELENISDKDLINLNVFARVTPEHKVKLVKLIKAGKNIIAMTGDGVNDAPALKNADIGIAMGITGTDVAKEAADMILLDDNFASIVKAIEEGRKIYDNIKKVVAYLLSCNIGEILLIFFAMILNFPIPLKPIHLLSINLITDAFPAFALGFEDKEDNIMQIKPNDPNESLINKRMRNFIITQSITLSLASLFCFIYFLKTTNYKTAMTACFVTLVSGELLRIYSARSSKKFIVQIKIFSNKFLNRCVIFSFIFLFCILYIKIFREIFYMADLSLNFLLIAFLFSLAPVLSGEVFKLYQKK